MASAMGAGPAISAMLSLAVILGLLAGAAYLARRLRGAPGAWRAPRDAQIQIIATRPLGVQSSLLIVEAQGQRFLIGAGRHGITAIGALDAPQSVPDFAALVAAPPSPPPPPRPDA